MTPTRSPLRTAFAHRDFTFFFFAQLLTTCAQQMLSVAVAQSVYELTHSPFQLGYVGLALFLPKISFTLFAGHTADRYKKRRVILCCRILEFLIVGLLIAVFHFSSNPLHLIYVVLFLLGTAFAFDGPARQAFVPQLVPAEDFSNATTWGATSQHIAVILGPVLSGWIYAVTGSAIVVFEIVLVMSLVSVIFILRVRNREEHTRVADGFSWETLVAGIKFVFRERIILGIISLDLFAVLLGGAVALMPIFANDILKVGPEGLGVLRAGPSIGAVLMGILIARLPRMKKAGQMLFVCVAIFGIATILFGLSQNFLFSLACLIVLGGVDMVSMVIRGVLVQTRTPQHMRGRVSAVNLIFIGASNELGEFESGLTAGFFGTVPAVLVGGVGTLVVVFLWAWLFPEIRNIGALEDG